MKVKVLVDREMAFVRTHIAVLSL